MPPLVYWSAKLSHSGVTGYKVFENCQRRVSRLSLSNLKGFQALQAELNNEICPQPLTRTLNETQSRKCKRYAQKLSFYSKVRKFHSNKTGSYKFKVAFLTLTCPESTTFEQAIPAFNAFLDYLRRTANCVYVWKKELGEENKHLHFHILVNNFIPYYIVSWKWKRLLIGQGVVWPVNSSGKATESHYRIELPRSRKLVSHYIAKYMSKAYALPAACGYVFGHSAVLDECEETRLIEGEFPEEEIQLLRDSCHTINDMYLTHICVDLREVSKFCPKLATVFKLQFDDFQDRISLEQKFWVVG